MVFGGTADERIQFNEDTLWTGEPHDYAHKGAVKTCPRSAGCCSRARARGRGRSSGEGVPERPVFAEGLSAVRRPRLHFPGHDRVADYRRELDLDAAIARSYGSAA